MSLQLLTRYGLTRRSEEEPSFDPTNLWGWWRADQGTFTTHDGNTASGASDPVGRWEDISGNDRHLLQSSAGNRPSLAAGIVNGKPVIRHNAQVAKRWLVLPDMSELQEAEAFIVVAISSDPPTQGIHSGLWRMQASTVPGMSTHYPFTDGTIYDSFGSTVRKTVGNPTPSLTAFHLYNVVSADGEWTARLDGAQLFTTSSNTVAFPAAPELGRSFSTNGEAGLSGDIAEFILFEQVCSSQQRDEVEAYVASRYGLTIA